MRQRACQVTNWRTREAGVEQLAVDHVGTARVNSDDDERLTAVRSAAVVDSDPDAIGLIQKILNGILPECFCENASGGS
jgi:hypothetical protein